MSGDIFESDSAALHCADVFRLLRKIFLQDISYYYYNFPTLQIFSSPIMRNHWPAFSRWIKLHTEVCDEVKSLQTSIGVEAPQLLSTKSKRVGSIVSLHDQCPSGFEIVPLEGSKHLGLLKKVIA